MPTLLHISDLHRTSDPRLNNDDLLAAIFSDAARWEAEGIPWPDLVVVSGDLIQGASVDDLDPDSKILAQYAEASEFLHQLASKFVGSDRSRVIIVPGNHDVDWNRARRAMNLVENCPDGIARKAYEPDSNVRWDWREQKAYEIVDSNMYQSRFDHFKQLQSDFYAGLDPSPLSHGDSDLVFFEDLSLGLVVIGFASWHGNDCFCYVGEIAPASVSLSQRLLADSTAPLAVAVWHHGILGGPRAHDYMDSRVIHRFIDFGFSVGLHGHQHYPGVAPFELRLPNLTSMVVVAGGSLAVGDSELPMGERRQFNIVVIDPNSQSITVHVRGMSHAGVFTGSHREDFGGNTFIKLGLSSSPSRPREATITQRIDDAMTAITVGQHQRALELITGIDSSHHDEIRLIKVRALDGLGRRGELIKLLNQPRSIDEAVMVISLLLEAGRIDEASATLETMSPLIDHSLYRELTAVIAVKKELS